MAILTFYFLRCSKIIFISGSKIFQDKYHLTKVIFRKSLFIPQLFNKKKKIQQRKKYILSETLFYTDIVFILIEKINYNIKNNTFSKISPVGVRMCKRNSNSANHCTKFLDSNRCLCTNVQGSIINNSQKVEKPWFHWQWMNTQNIFYIKYYF